MAADLGDSTQPEVLAEECREYVLKRLPQDLIEQFDVRWEDADFKVSVRLKREPTKEELDHVSALITDALEEFRGKLDEQTTAEPIEPPAV